MHGKEFIAEWLRSFFSVVTMINIAMCLMGSAMLPEMRFGYRVFIVPVIYGLAGTMPNLVMYSKRELKIRELMVRKVLQFILTEICVLFVAFYGSSESDRPLWLIGIVALSIFVIFVLAVLFEWLQNYLSAKQLTEDLKIFQGKVRE